MRNMYFLVSDTGSQKEQNLSLTPYRSWTYDFLVAALPPPPHPPIHTHTHSYYSGENYVFKTASYMATSLCFFWNYRRGNNTGLVIFSCDINIGNKRKKKGKSAKRKEKRRRLAEARKVCKQLLVFYIIIHLLCLQDLLKKIADVTKGNIKLLL